LEEKEKWDAAFFKRKKIKTILDNLDPEFFSATRWRDIH